MSNTFPIIMYHRVNTIPGLALSGESLDYELFLRQLDRLCEEYDVWSLQRVLTTIKSKEEIPDNVATLSFDDGTKDQIEWGLPALRARGLPATFFVMSGPLYGGIPPTFKMQLITGGKFDLSWIANEVFPEVLESIGDDHLVNWREGIDVPPEHYIGEPTEEVRQMKWLTNFLMDAESKIRTIDSMFDRLFSELDEASVAAQMFFSQEDLRTIADTEGMTIGGHSHTHPNLSQPMTDSELQHELVSSQNKIGGAIGRTVGLFAYPSGQYASAAAAVVRSQYEAAFIVGTQKDDASIDTSVYELPRVHERHFFSR